MVETLDLHLCDKYATRLKNWSLPIFGFILGAKPLSCEVNWFDSRILGNKDEKVLLSVLPRYFQVTAIDLFYVGQIL